ncbi:MAG: hypothetical protein EBU66_16900 [Bacteroidetes bacterium]|nr:hypothetical protein [Bacteroidota bacterium]
MYQSLIQTGKKRTKQKERHRALILADDEQEYAVVRELMGNGRVKVTCQDGQDRQGRIRGAMRHAKSKVLIDKGDLLIVSGRGDYDLDKVDIIHKYNHEEARHIVSLGVVTESLSKIWGQLDGGHNNIVTENDEYFEFAEKDINML